MVDVLRRSHEKGLYQHIHGTGKSGWESVCAKLREAGVPLKGDGIWVREYIDDMPRCMAAADLVISRCGAMTLSELPAAGKASILIPSPNVAENHQYHNAMALVNRGPRSASRKRISPPTRCGIPWRPSPGIRMCCVPWRSMPEGPPFSMHPTVSTPLSRMC